jgi:hypothetical protein
VVHRCVDEIYAAEQIVRVVEMLDEVAQALGGIGGQVKDVFEFVLGKNIFDEPGIGDGTFNELYAGWNMVTKTAAQIVQADDLVPLPHQMRRDVRTDEPGRAGDQNL